MVNKLKQYFYIGIVLLILGLISTVYIQSNTIKARNKQLSTTTNNYKALEQNIVSWKDRYNIEHSRIIEYQQNLYSFNNSKDSLTKLLQNTIKQSQIKDKNLKEAGIIISELKAKIIADSINSTIVINNDSTKTQTIKDNTFTAIAKIDSKKAVINELEITANIEQDILFYTHKETINSARKFILWRLFQKKQTICNIEIINKNKAIHTKQAKFIKIIK